MDIAVMDRGKLLPDIDPGTASRGAEGAAESGQEI
jgi:hypothetical protein